MADDCQCNCGWPCDFSPSEMREPVPLDAVVEVSEFTSVVIFIPGFELRHFTADEANGATVGELLRETQKRSVN
jgi:hypothetical protein